MGAKCFPILMKTSYTKGFYEDKFEFRNLANNQGSLSIGRQNEANHQHLGGRGASGNSVRRGEATI